MSAWSVESVPEPNLWEEILKEFASRRAASEEALILGSSSLQKDIASIPHERKTCPPREYLETYIFPTLLPALQGMLEQAKTEKCFERKRTKFNGLDFLTEYLYRGNIVHSGRSTTDLWSIPFVKNWLVDHPRAPLPMSLLWSEEEAALRIQRFWRGHVVRRRPECQELRQWQKQWRWDTRNMHKEVDSFWQERMDAVSSTTSTGHTLKEKISVVST